MKPFGLRREVLLKEEQKASLIASSSSNCEAKDTCLLDSVVPLKKTMNINFSFLSFLLHATFASLVVGTAQVSAVYDNLDMSSYICNTCS